MTDAQSMIEVHSKVSDTTYNAEYSTNQPHLKRDTRTKRKKRVSHVCTCENQILHVPCMCYLNQLLNRYAVVRSLSVGTSKY